MSFLKNKLILTTFVLALIPLYNCFVAGTDLAWTVERATQ